jgi:methylmalonyl-CoA carboxyltransferase large subunit
VNLTDLVQALSERQQATEGQLKALADTLKALEAQVAGFSPAAARPEQAASPEKGKVTPEVLVMIAAAVTAFLGKKVRIRSAKMLQSPYEVVNPWSQQGRVFVQASHNLRPRR